MGEPAELVLTNVTKVFPAPEGTVAVLQEVSLTASPGETIAIVGPSGAGKSTLLHIIGSLDRPTTGQVRLGDIDVVGLADAALARYRADRVGFVFQDHHLLPQLTALENVLIPTLTRPGADATDRARTLLTRVGLETRAEAFPAALSGGERQRVAVARALMNGAALLLCDEPTGNLDRETGMQVASLLFTAAREQGATVLLVTHNPELAAMCDRCCALRAGRLVSSSAYSREAVR